MDHQQAAALFIIALAAALLPLVARRMALPAMVLEILFGLVLREAGFGEAFSGEWLYFLAHFGFLMLMFMAGLEIDFEALRAEPPRYLLVYVVAFAMTVLLSYGVARLLGFGLFLALVLSTTSLGLVLPALRELNLSRTPLGQSALLSATMADFLTLLGLTGLVLYAQYGWSWRLVRPVPVFLFFGLTLWGLRLWAWWHPERALRLLGRSDASELGVRAVLALLFIFVGLSALLDLEPILGAFLGGCVIAAVFPRRGALEDKLSGFAYGFLIPIFFIHVGTQFAVESFREPGLLALTGGILVAAVGVKLLPSLLLRLRGLPLESCFLVGVLLCARLSLIVAATAIGVERGLLPPRIEPVVVVVALLTTALAPTAFRRLARSGTLVARG